MSLLALEHWRIEFIDVEERKSLLSRQMIQMPWSGSSFQIWVSDIIDLEYFCGGFIFPHVGERLGLGSYPFCTLQLVGDLAPQKACWALLQLWCRTSFGSDLLVCAAACGYFSYGLGMHMFTVRTSFCSLRSPAQRDRIEPCRGGGSKLVLKRGGGSRVMPCSSVVE